MKIERILSIFWLLALALACALSCLWHDLFAEFANPFVLDSSDLTRVVGIAMLAAGSLARVDDVHSVARRRSSALASGCALWLAPPTLAFIVAKLFHFDGARFVGIMAVVYVTSSFASILFTHTARGNTSYSFGLTTLTTLLSPLVIPPTLALFFRDAKLDLDFDVVIRDFVVTVVIPFGLGFACSHRWSWWRACSSRFGSFVVNLALVWLVASALGKNIGSTSSLTPQIVAASLTLNLGGCLVGYLSGVALRLPRGMLRAQTLVFGIQNAGLGASFCAISFAESKEAVLFCASYSLVSMTTGIILAHALRLLTPHEESDCAQTEQSQQE